MSIINDALKKVQSNLNNNQKPPEVPMEESKPISPYDQPSAPPPTPIADNLPVEVIKKDHEQLKKNIVATLISLVVVAVAAGVTWFQIKDMPQVKEWLALTRAKTARAVAHKVSAKQATEVKPLAQVTIEQASPVVTPVVVPDGTTTPAATEVVKPLPPLTLKIHGVMANGSANIALINDQVYQEGDTVQGVKILKISLNEIVVLNNGREQTIAVGK